VNELGQLVNCADSWFARYHNVDFQFSEWWEIKTGSEVDQRPQWARASFPIIWNIPPGIAGPARNGEVIRDAD
jgi:hypothetical protein